MNRAGGDGRRPRATARASRPVGKLLVLTILFVMIAEVLIYVPSIANFPAELAATTGSPPPTPPRWCSSRRPSGMVPDRSRARSSTASARARSPEDGPAAPPAGGLRHAAEDQPRHRHARHALAPRHHRRLRDADLRRQATSCGWSARRPWAASSSRSCSTRRRCASDARLLAASCCCR